MATPTHSEVAVDPADPTGGRTAMQVLEEAPDRLRVLYYLTPGRATVAQLVDAAVRAAERCRGVPEDVVNLVLVKKLRSAPVVWLVMRKFLMHPKCQVVRSEDAVL